ncbi:MAG: glycosyltransferase [Nitrospirae bacterium]|nr:MAG: glycosyltransferase [Nitrospirota bacterium]
MQIALLIPTLNEERLLARTLAYTCTLPFDELIVVDGGSHDRTVPIAESLVACSPIPRVAIVSAPRGRARQMNAGAAQAQSEILVFLHADTWLPPNAREAIERALEDPNCVGGRFDVQFESDKGWAWIISRLMNLRSRWSGIATGDQALFVRRRVFEEMGGFAEIPIMEDIDFSARLKRRGRLAPLREKVTTSFRRWEQQGPVYTILHMWTLRLLYWMGISPNILRHFYGHAR